jgi:hypothetical protein
MPKRITDTPNLCCPSCGADQLIPMTYAVYQRRGGSEVRSPRPLAKCFGCGTRIYAKVIAQ